METLLFGNCTLTSLDKRFGLRQIFTPGPLNEWLDSPVDLSGYEREVCEHLRALLRLNMFGWNEQELSLHFIGPLFSLAEISSQQYNLFANRQIGAEVGDCYLTGKPDGMVASGYREPEIPYFAFNEYKKEVDPDGDPAAQALAPMLVGRELNGDNRPVYGCFVIGENWRFMVLTGNEYSISAAYSASNSEVLFIAGRLKVLKAIVEQYVLQPPSTFVQSLTVA